MMVVDRGRLKRRDVRLGLVGVGKAEILSGVAADDLVVPAGTAPTLKPGDRVRARAGAGKPS